MNATDAPIEILRKNGKGYSIHSEATDDRGTLYTLYTNDGKGNGDYVCETTDLWWVKTIAGSLNDHFDANGN
jgi:hypothetical protein